jgi:hypothetical protein
MQFQNYDHTKWANFAAWKILSVSPKFRPPSPMSMIMNDPLNVTMVYPTAPPANVGGHQANHSAVVPSTNHPVVPSMVALLPCVAEMPMLSSIQMEPTNMPHASGSLLISTMELYLQSSKQARNEVLAMSPPKSFSFSSATNTTLFILDPSKGGRGSVMGNKKAKAEYKCQQIEMEKSKQLELITKTLKNKRSKMRRLTRF